MSASVRASRTATNQTPVKAQIFTPGVTAADNFKLMTQSPEKVVAENRVSRYDYVHHKAAEDPTEYSHTRLAQ